jgi:hypothetical protein
MNKQSEKQPKEWYLVCEITAFLASAEQFYLNAEATVENYSLKRKILQLKDAKGESKQQLIDKLPDDFSIKNNVDSELAGVAYAFEDSAKIVDQHSDSQLVQRIAVWESWSLNWLVKKLKTVSNKRIKNSLASAAAEQRLLLDEFLALVSDEVIS